MRPRVLTVVGARPQFIKASVVSAELTDRGVEEILVHTGQHFDENMSKVFFDELGIRPPAEDLGVRASTHATMTAEMLVGLERSMQAHGPDVVLVYGDTNSTLAGALAAAKLHLPVVHVEAGLRSFNRSMPEEINRVVTDHLSDLLLTPTATATNNLRAEGVDADHIAQVGDVMYDAALHFAKVARGRAESPLDRFGLSRGEYVLATIHRAENTDDPERLAAIVDGLAEISAEVQVLLPLHPRTRKVLRRSPGCVQVVEPLGYLDMIELEAGARLICTDSGGVQKEAFFHHVPCVTLRDETEWTELVELGWNRVVPPVSAPAVTASLRAVIASAAKGDQGTPYGDGRAAARVAEEIALRFGRMVSR